MSKPIELKTKGIKCDACDYKDMSVKREDYDLWLNKPCPACGANLLTEADYDKLIEMEKVAEFLNKGFEKLPAFLQKSLLGKADKKLSIPIEADGSGEVDFDIENMKEIERKD